MNKIILLLLFVFALTIADQTHEKLHHKAKHSKHVNHHVLGERHSKLKYREHGQVCKWVCQPPTNSSNSSNSGDLFGNYLQLVTVNSTFVAIVNSSANVSVSLDYRYNNVAFFDGESGLAIVISLNTSLIYQLNTSDSTWHSQNQTFEAYLKTIRSFTVLIDSAKNSSSQCVNASNISSDLLNQISNILTLVGGKNLSTPADLQNFINKSIKVSDVLNGPLLGFYNQNITINTPIGVTFNINLLIALGKLLENVNGGLAALQKGGVKLDLSQIYNVTNGIEVILIVLTEIGEHFDLSKLLGNILNNPQQFLEIIALFDDNSGVDGLFTIISDVYSLVNGTGTIEKLVEDVVNFVSNDGAWNTTLSEFSKIINAFLKLVQSQNSSFNNAAGLQNFTKFLQSLSNNSLTINNISVSEIINILSNGNGTIGIQRIITVFFKFGDILGPNHGIPQFIQNIIRLFNNTNDLNVLTKLLPGLNLANFTNGGSILQNILKGANLTQFLNGTGNITDIIGRIPVLGDILKEIKKIAPTPLDFGKIFNSTSVTDSFKKLFSGAGFENIIQQFEKGFEQIIPAVEHGIQGIFGIGNGGGNSTGGLGDILRFTVGGRFEFNNRHKKDGKHHAEHLHNDNNHPDKIDKHLKSQHKVDN